MATFRTDRRSPPEKVPSADGLMGAFRRLCDDLDAGADPIEAMSGHVCSVRCWHYELGDEAQRERIRRIGKRRG